MNQFCFSHDPSLLLALFCADMITPYLKIGNYPRILKSHSNKSRENSFRKQINSLNIIADENKDKNLLNETSSNQRTFATIQAPHFLSIILILLD